MNEEAINIFYEKPVNDLIMMIREEIINHPEIPKFIKLPDRDGKIDLETLGKIDGWVNDNKNEKKAFVKDKTNEHSPRLKELDDENTDAEYSTGNLLTCIRDLKPFDSKPEDEQNHLKKEFLKHFLSLWIFEYNEVTDELISRYIFCPAVPHYADMINKITVIPDGRGSVGYSVKKKESIAINDTEEDPRGSVSIEDKLLRNFSYLDVPITKKEDGKENVIYAYSIFLPYQNAWEWNDGDRRLTGLIEEIIDKYIPNFVILENYAKSKRLNSLFATREEIDNEEKLIDACHDYANQVLPVLLTCIIEKSDNDEDHKLEKYLKININKINSLRRKNQLIESYSTAARIPTKKLLIADYDFLDEYELFRIEYNYTGNVEEFRIVLKPVYKELSELLLRLFSENYFKVTDYTILKDKINICNFIVSTFSDFMLMREADFLNKYLIPKGSSNDDIFNNIKKYLSVILFFPLRDKDKLIEDFGNFFNNLVKLKNRSTILGSLLSMKIYLKNSEQKIIKSKPGNIENLFHPSTINILQLIDEKDSWDEIYRKYPPLIHIEDVRTLGEKKWKVGIKTNLQETIYVDIMQAYENGDFAFTPLYYYMDKSNYEEQLSKSLREKRIDLKSDEDEFTKKLNDIDTEIAGIGKKIKHPFPISDNKHLIIVLYSEEASYSKNSPIGSEHIKIIENILKNYTNIVASQEKSSLDVKVKEAEGWAHQLNSHLVVLGSISDIIEKRNQDIEIEGLDILKPEVHSIESYTTIIQEQKRIDKKIYFNLDEVRRSYEPLLIIEDLIISSLRIAFLKFCSDTRNEFILDRDEIFKENFLDEESINAEKTVKLEIIESLVREKDRTAEIIKEISKIKVEIKEEKKIWVVPLIAQSLQFHFTEIFVNALKHFHKVKDSEKFIRIEIDDRLLQVSLNKDEITKSTFKFRHYLINGKPFLLNESSKLSNNVGFIKITFSNSFTIRDLTDKKIKTPGTKLGLKVIPEAVKNYFDDKEIDSKLRYVGLRNKKGEWDYMEYEDFQDFYNKILKSEAAITKYEKEVFVYKISLPIPVLLSS